MLPASLAVFLFLPVTQADAKTVPIGKGSGQLTQTSMSGLEEGDTLVIAKGIYSGGTFTNLKGVTIVPETPGVTFKGSIIINHNDKVTFDGMYPVNSDNPDPTSVPKPVYGYTFSGFNGDAFVPLGNNMNLTIKGVLCSDIRGAIDGGPKKIITYTGTDETTLYKNLTVDYLKCTGRTTVYSGTWEPPTTYNNVNIGMTLKHVVIVNDGSGITIKVFGNSIYQMVADTWNIVRPTLIMTGDCGVFHIAAGNVTLRNIYRNGGWGDLLRIWNCSLREPSDTYMINCIDINTESYNTIDCNIDPRKLALNAKIPIVGNNVHLFNVTSGDKKDISQWVSQLLILGNMSDGTHDHTVEIKNCFAFNAMDDWRGTHTSLYVLNGSSSLKGMIMANNVDVFGPLPDGYLIDKVHFYPSSGSPLIGTGVVLPEVTTDIYGHPRGDKPDIGAVQHSDNKIDENYDLSPGSDKLVRTSDQRPTASLNHDPGAIPPDAGSPYLKKIEGSQVIRYLTGDNEKLDFFKANKTNDRFVPAMSEGKMVRVLFKIPGNAPGGPSTAIKVYQDYDARLKADGWETVYSGINTLAKGTLKGNIALCQHGQVMVLSATPPKTCYYIYATKHGPAGDVQMGVTFVDFNEDDWLFKKDEVAMSVDSIQSRP